MTRVVCSCPPSGHCATCFATHTASLWTVTGAPMQPVSTGLLFVPEKSDVFASENNYASYQRSWQNGNPKKCDGLRELKKEEFWEKLSQTGGRGQSVFILLFRNLKAQNGIFWARIECLDNSVCGWSTIPHQYISKYPWTTSPPPAAVCEIIVVF